MHIMVLPFSLNIWPTYFKKRQSSRGLIRGGMNGNSPLMFAVVERCHSDKVLPSDSEVKRRGISLRAGQ